MQASTNTQAPSGRRSRRGSRVLLAVLAALVVSLFVLLESGRPTQAIMGGWKATEKIGLVALMYHWDATDPDPTNPDPNVHPYGANPQCTGTLIDEDSVLTAAHCLYDDSGNPLNPTYLEVIAGATKLFAGEGVVRDVTEVQVHDMYRPSGTYPFNSDKYDVAVLTLNQPAPDPKKLYLATQADNSLEQGGTEAVVAGWGLTQPCSKTLTREEKLKVCRPEEQLRWVRYPVRGDEAAIHFFSGIKGLQDARFKFHPALMVAAGDQTGQGACGGDSGGPLFVENKTYTRGTIIGVASLGVCGERNVDLQGQRMHTWPDVYTEVNNRSIRTFILNAMR